MALLLSPAEPKVFWDLGTVSSLTERHGCDFMVPTPNRGWVGVQRKAVADYVASFSDGRLQEELMRMIEIPTRVLLIEGYPRWGADGMLSGVSNDERVVKSAHSSFRRDTWWGSLLSIEERGFMLMQTGSLGETRQFLQELERWAAKEHHRMLDTRRGPEKVGLGVVTKRLFLLHLLQSFRGIGPETAEAIIDHFGGVPLAWTVTEKELCAVKGVGKTRAKIMVEALEQANEAIRDVRG